MISCLRRLLGLLEQSGATISLNNYRAETGITLADINFEGCSWTLSWWQRLGRGRVFVSNFESHPPRRGGGTQALTLLCHCADAVGLGLTLIALPYSPDYGPDPAIPKRVLIKWYHRFGFCGKNQWMTRTALGEVT
jgi:hypothetical protein